MASEQTIIVITTIIILLLLLIIGGLLRAAETARNSCSRPEDDYKIMLFEDDDFFFDELPILKDSVKVTTDGESVSIKFTKEKEEVTNKEAILFNVLDRRLKLSSDKDFLLKSITSLLNN